MANIKSRRGKRIPLVSKRSVSGFGATVRQRRIERFGENISEASRSLGITRTLLWRIEAGSLIPRADVYLQICQEFGLTPDSALDPMFASKVQLLYSTPDYGQFVRIVAEPFRTPKESRLTFDAVVDVNNRITATPVLGVWGRYDAPADTFSPFVLYENGVLVYDAAFRKKERLWSCDLRNVEIVQGASFNYVGDGRASVRYRIVRLDRLLQS